MKKAMILIVITMFLVVSCDSDNDSANTADTANSANSADSVDSGNSGDTGNTGDSADGGNAGDSADSADSGNSVDSADTTDTANTADTGNNNVPDNIIPTNQTKCFNNTEEISCPEVGEDYYGQDTQYPNTERTFTVSGTVPEEIVTDSITSLSWQKSIDSPKQTLQNAKDYCSSLQYGGFDDWQLPTIEALATLSDYGHHNPAIDSNAFPGTPSDAFWSSTPDPYDPRGTESVDFIDGRVFNSLKSDGYVRCVRGAFSFDSHFLGYEPVEGNTCIIDTRTNLLWTRRYWEAKTWQEALEYCENLVYMRKNDWRLPNVNELRTLIDYSKNSPASNFPDMPISHSFWSSTTHSEFRGSAWSVSSSSGAITGMGKQGNNVSSVSIRCIRLPSDSEWW